MTPPTSTPRTASHRLQVATVLYRFIEDKVLPGTGVASATFWSKRPSALSGVGGVTSSATATRCGH